MSVASGIKVPSAKDVAWMRDPASAPGAPRLTSSFRIAGGARNVGFRRPPTLSSGRTHLRKVAAGFFATIFSADNQHGVGI